MIRITSIGLENYRAFYGKYEPINLPNGENLLTYGENGSVKSSFFKALKHYFQSSRDDSFGFEINSYVNIPANGSIEISFASFDPVTNVQLPGSLQTLTFNNSTSNHDVAFVQNADLIKGFLDYRNLLDVYNHKSPRPNLFNLIVEDLLFEYIPIGGTEGLGRWYKRLKTDIESSYSTRARKHRNALHNFPAFEHNLRNTLDRVFLRLNLILIKYFKLNLRVEYQLSPITNGYNGIRWRPSGDLRLNIKLNGQPLLNQYDFLNEARLSALATSLYLASIIENPSHFDCKILFLDDVFIGLDTSNRRPILEILTNEFKQHQIFINTYDRHWFELAQRYFEVNSPGRWISNSLYVGKVKVDNANFDKPLLIQRDNDYSKGVYYLHHPDMPDYPASANYFRKFSEELLTSHLPPHEVRNEDYSLIESYKLNSLVNSGLHFLKKLGKDEKLLRRLKNALPTLLHPLSHYNLSSPVYKGELIDVQDCLKELEAYLIGIKASAQVFMPAGKMFKLKFIINANETGYYEIYSKEAVYLIREGAGLRLSLGACHAKTCYVINGGTINNKLDFRNTDTRVQYDSVEHAYENIYNYVLQLPQYAHINKAVNCYTEFEMSDGTIWRSLDQLMV